MNTKFNTAAIKCLEAAKLIQSMKEPALKETVENTCRILWQISAELLRDDVKVPNSKK